MAGHPDAPALVEAVQAFLKSVEGELSGRSAFHAKVAGNALAIVARELRQRPELAEAAALAPFGDAGSICAALRDGRFDIGTPGLVDALTAATVARLAVDNPRYATLERLGGS